MSHTDALQLEDQVRYYSVVASVPDSLHRQQLKAFDLVWRSMRMAWTMILRPDSSGKEQWTTVDYFSTLTSSSMPVSGMAFFDDFVKELRRAWLMLCDTIDIHLRFCVSLFFLPIYQGQGRANIYKTVSVQKSSARTASHEISSIFCCWTQLPGPNFVADYTVRLRISETSTPSTSNIQREAKPLRPFQPR